MDKKSKILLIVVVLAVIISVGYTFYQTIIKGDFEVINTSEEEEESSEFIDEAIEEEMGEEELDSGVSEEASTSTDIGSSTSIEAE